MRAKRSLGQNFLQDESVSERIVAALGVQTGERVVEIGPGVGALTEKLLEMGAEVIAIEFDRDLIDGLRERFRDYAGFTVIQDDALSLDFATLRPSDSKLKLVANLPYNISTPILQRLIDYRQNFDTLVLMFQREVVERITAVAGTKERGFLTVLVEDALAAERLFDVPPTAFKPVPKVWSSVVKLTPTASSTTASREFRGLISAGFAQKRKTILNNLKNLIPNAAAHLAAAGIDPGRRAETLTIGEWRGLAAAIFPHGGQ